MNTNRFLDEELQDYPAWLRLEDQLKWYDTKSSRNKRWYKRLRVIQLTLAASIPVIALSGQDWNKWITAIFGGLIAVLEGVQQLNQFGPQWVEYRSTAEHLKHEKFLFLSQSAHYRGLSPQDALRLLAERVEENVSQEHARWTCASKHDLKEKHS
jgi:hypothetical protein